MSKILSIIAVLFLGLIAIFIQGSLLRTFLPDFLVPNLMVSIVVFLAFYDNTPFGACLAFLLGLEIDLYGGNPLLVGPSAGALVLAYGILASLSKRVYVESSFAVACMAALSSIIYAIIYSILIYEFNDAAARYFSLSVSNAFVTGLITPFIFRFFAQLLGKRKIKTHGSHSTSSRSRSGRGRGGSYKVKNV